MRIPSWEDPLPSLASYPPNSLHLFPSAVLKDFRARTHAHRERLYLQGMKDTYATWPASIQAAQERGPNPDGTSPAAESTVSPTAAAAVRGDPRFPCPHRLCHQDASVDSKMFVGFGSRSGCTRLTG